MEYIVKKEDWDSFIKEFSGKYIWNGGEELKDYNPFRKTDEIYISDTGETGGLKYDYPEDDHDDGYIQYNPSHKPVSQFTQVTTPRFCGSCGFYINDDSLYCRMCGTKVEENWYDKH